MHVLEKILEEIKEKIKFAEKLMVEKPCDKLDKIANDTAESYILACEECCKIIRSHMDDVNNDGWIPVEERLPEEYDSIFAKFKGTDKWSNAMFEKKSDEVNVTVEFEDGTRKTGTSYILDGRWKCEKENRFVKQKVVAWQPLPKQYEGE